VHSSILVERHDAVVVAALGGVPGDAVVGMLLGDLGFPLLLLMSSTIPNSGS
jgi:hypothetical protein